MVDTTVLVAGVVWPRFSYEVLQHAIRGNFDLILCQHVIIEAKRVFRERFPGFTQDLENLLTLVPYEEAPDVDVQEVWANAALLRDITDVPVALSAIKVQADFFISDDKDYTAADQPIHEKLRVFLPGTFLNQVMGRSHQELEQIRRRRWTDLSVEET